MNMLRHKKNCKNNIENHFDYQDRKKQEELIIQKKLLIKEFKNLNIREVKKEIKNMSNADFKSMIKEVLNKEMKSAITTKVANEDTYVNPNGNFDF